MFPVRQRKVRELLRQNPAGLSPLKIAEITGIHPANVRTALRSMPDVYVDRWAPAKRGQYEKIYVAVHVPEDCPHPKDREFKGGKGLPKTKWQRVEPWGPNAVS